MEKSAFNTKLMGILNATPDSFFDGGRFFDLKSAISKGCQLANEGADILDIGGESTRPNAPLVTEEEEISRVIPLILALKSEITVPISIDTYKAEVAKRAIKAGASMVNDICGFQDPKMIELAADTGVQIVVMHMRGCAEMRHQNLNQKSDIIEEITDFFEEKVNYLMQKGVNKEQIILDPGIGFGGKSIADNLQIIHNLSRFKKRGFPLLLGISRKSFMGKILKTEACDLLPATLAINTAAIMQGIDIIRVHDVKEHQMVINVMQKYLEQIR